MVVFRGKNCEIDINECELEPCLNGGTCRDLVNRYECSWAEGRGLVNPPPPHHPYTVKSLSNFDVDNGGENVRRSRKATHPGSVLGPVVQI
jgi:hypothetical protein